MKRTWKIGNKLVAILLGALTVIILTATAPQIGLTWDEPYDIASSITNLAWFKFLAVNPVKAFKLQVIDQYWADFHGHPALDKIWSGLVWSLTRHIFDDLTAHRLGNILLVGVLVGVLYLLIANAYGKAAGLFSAGALLSMPRFFFHSHLAVMDVPVAVAVFVVTILFWWTIDRKEWWWGVVLGLAWGLAEAIKLNATFIPVGLLIWFLAFRRSWYVVMRFLLMGLVAVFTFILVWPWLYHQTWTRILYYINFLLQHPQLGQWYFGQFYSVPPWHFVLVMLWAVVPLTVILLAFLGVARAGKGGHDKGLVWLLIISALVPLLPFIGGFVVFDNERLFMPVFPFLAALAGVGFGWIIDGLRRLAKRIDTPVLFLPVGVLLGVGLLMPQVVTMTSLYPHLLSYYSEGVGGLPGATKMGLETTYWCETYVAAIPYINAHARPGDLVWVEPDSYNVLLYYQIHGQLRSDVKILNDVSEPVSVFGPGTPQPVKGPYTRAEWVIFQYRQSQFGKAGYNFPLLAYLEKLALPVYQVSYQGVPLMGLYKR